MALSRLLDEYRQVRQLRVADATKRKQAEAALLISGLQQRLLSSIEAFARTLKVHRRTMERLWARENSAAMHKVSRARKHQTTLLSGDIGNDDDLSQLSEEELQALEDAEIEAATETTAGEAATANVPRERELLDKMDDIAERFRGLPDARVRYLIDWIRENMCPGVHLPGQKTAFEGVDWNNLRLLIFTEYEDTKRYLVNMLRAAVAGTRLEEHRIEVFHGPTPPDKREQIKRAFNTHPEQHPVRILIATDAAREGINLQAHCWNLFHFDVPWNPSRLEQRNGRIDRKLQPSSEVFCHYFVYKQRPEDRVLKALVRKTKTIREELGSLSEVLESRLAKTLRGGIEHSRADAVAKEIEDANLDDDKRQTTEEELEAARDRQEKLREQISTLERRVEEARSWIGLDNDALRDAISCSLEMLGAAPLKADEQPDGEPARFVFPHLHERLGSDPSWATTLDTLRTPAEDGESGFQWRKNAAIRPVVFDSPSGVDDTVVQLHLHHRVVQRLLGRFLAQGFVHHDLSRACLAHSMDSVPRVVLLGRLSLYGPGATRLHEEILTVTARWSEASRRKDPLAPYARDTEARTLELLEEALGPSGQRQLSESIQRQLLESLPQDIEELLPHLKERGEAAREEAAAALADRGEAEATAMRQVLEDQRKRVLTELGREIQLDLLGDDQERRQYESNRKYWERWVSDVEDALRKEPARIKTFYEVNSFRIEPVGIAYLYPADK